MKRSEMSSGKLTFSSISDTVGSANLHHMIPNGSGPVNRNIAHLLFTLTTSAKLKGQALLSCLTIR